MPYLSRKLGFTLVVLLNLCLIAGCGGGGDKAPSGRVSGSVKLNGEPVFPGKITLTSATIGAAGSADLTSDGEFTFEGPLPVGQYKVYLTSAGLGDSPPSENPKADANKGLKDVPQKYQSETTTDLTATIEEGKNTIPLELSP
ncbi:carboxypeptidase-like regulatory domain-containing protein [Thalassoglobus polymorphus]|uniref:Carboxypeptidase regulatory-like domain-containing protein n=1 Tax=Thalassoglobus polymorphus TaxID=2527994 RepID=A0A517QKU8_9PLAN|nr:carboxypeptidase-like regulatory domain-containing protein [Thalassoglobus polymorphus]QDT32248.1 hypothetical protein Mal48_14910 [Thalassoglobus polymorphus]